MIKLGVRIWILIFFILFSIIAINPKFDVSGVEIKSLGELGKEQGMQLGEIIKEVNGKSVNTVEEFNNILNEDTKVEAKNISLVTNNRSVNYEAKYNLGFEVDENLTIISSDINISVGDKLKSINNKVLNNSKDFEDIKYDLLPKNKLEIKTNKKDYAFLVNKEPKIDVKLPSKNNIKKGLDLEGGTRILLEPIKESGEVTTKDILDLMSVLRNRLNVYGLTDLKIRAAEGGDKKYVLVEIAGVSKDDIEGFIATQGIFEAKIGEEVAFRGGKNEIPFVCKDDGTCSGTRSCDKFQEGGYICKFQFSIKLSLDAAKNHAKITKDMNVITIEGGQNVLEKKIEFYLDGKLIDSLNIDADLKGNEATDILITGSGSGATEESAYQNALDNMDKLQSVLITGSLPFKLEIAKLDSISPVFGQNFIKNIFLVFVVSVTGVLAVVYLRYRNLKVILPMAITLACEILGIIGIAALVGWNLDLASIAGIIAAVGTGVDDQIVITDEIMRGEREKFYSWKEKMKKAFFIIFVAYFATIAAMLPMWNAAAGLIRGFALTTIIGVSVGVFITRPAFASMLEKLMEKK